MARVRRPSDDAYNARRRAKRLAARLEKQGRHDEAAGLKALARTAYAGGTTSPAELDAYVKEVSSRPSRPAKTTSKVPATAQGPAPSVYVSRPRKASDDVYNARRRLRRQAAKIEREAEEQPEGIRKQMLSFARSLREKAEEAKGRMDAETRAKFLESLADLRERTKGASYGASRIYRRNLIFQQQMNAAGTMGADSAITQRQKDTFWMAVKGLWPDGTHVPRNERYNRVIDHFYFKDTSDAKDFRKWLRDEKGLDMKDVIGDLQLVFEYIVTELNKDVDTDEPEVPYDELKKIILTLR